MTLAQQNRLKSFDASLAARGVDVTLHPGDLELCCLVEPVDEHTRKRLQIADDTITHVLHVKRDDLGAAALDAISEIARADSGQTYRVQHFEDDPQRPAVLFHCILGGSVA